MKDSRTAEEWWCGFGVLRDAEQPHDHHRHHFPATRPAKANRRKFWRANEWALVRHMEEQQ